MSMDLHLQLLIDEGDAAELAAFLVLLQSKVSHCELLVAVSGWFLELGICKIPQTS